MTLDFITKVKGLEVSVSILSEVPADLTPVWDFGVVGGSTTEETNYTYETSGRYTITLYLQDAKGEKEAVGKKVVMVSEYTKTQLTDSIYNLINKYIPENLNLSMGFDDKAAYITKWQLYIQPLVNHYIPIEEYSNELYYEGLENQLVMELAAYDFLYIKIENMLIQTASQLEDQINSSDDGGETEVRDRIKQITTGPTEVQYFDTVTESISTLFKAYADATKPGGILDDLRKNLCMLAQRMDIFLPFCTQPRTIKVPKVVNHRHAGPIGGPNPGSLVHIPKDSIL